MDFLVLDETFTAIKILEVFESFIWTDRYSAYGDFEIYMPPNLEILKILKSDYYIWSGESEHMMIIEDRQITSDAEEGNHLMIVGRSLESILQRRIVWQQTILSGNFQQGIKTLINENIISPVDSSRKIANFIFEESTDPNITQLIINAQFTGDNLYDAIKKLCDSKNVGFKIRLSDDNIFIFSLYYGIDRSYNQFLNPYVIFSPNFDNLINSNYLESKKDLKTVTLVAGEGEGLDRRREEVSIDSGAGEGLSRREMYTDARDISSNDGEVDPETYKAQLIQRGKNYLSENVIVKAFEGDVDTQHKYAYGKDFFMGDIVQIANEYGIEATSRITELVRSQTSSGVTILPTFTTIEE